jgi:catechol 2,3-dioxygenase-like lactoylglutathione lyase family enzyme
VILTVQRGRAQWRLNDERDQGAARQFPVTSRARVIGRRARLQPTHESTDGGSMSSAGLTTEASTGRPEAGTIDMKLEVVTLPVSDVDRAKAFYQRLGWRLDIDLVVSDDIRAVQFTPPHSHCSVAVAKGLTGTQPGSVQRLELTVSDIDAARNDLIRRGVEVSEPFHLDAGGIARGPHPQRASYQTYASFNDPDGNGWLLQEVTERLPNREWED